MINVILIQHLYNKIYCVFNVCISKIRSVTLIATHFPAMSFLNLFKSKKPKKNKEPHNTSVEEEPGLPARRCSISRSGRLKQKKVRQPLTVTDNLIHSEQCVYNDHNNSEDENLNEDEIVNEIYKVADSHLETAL